MEGLLFGTKGQLEGENKLPVSEEDKKAIENAIAESLAWMEANKQASKEEYEAKKKAFEAIIHPIMAKMQA